MAKDRFESLIYEFLIAKFPGAGIKKVEGAGGDQGIDSFSGTLGDGPTIWQCKHFSSRLQPPQKKQILKSIKTAFTFRKPRRWVLCLSIDLTHKEHEWFEREVAAKYKLVCPIELIQGSEIIAELNQNRPLRDAFFPDNLVSNARSIIQLASNTATASIEQRERLIVEHAEQLLEGYRDLEPRLQPFLSIGVSGAPKVGRGIAEPVFSINRGATAIDFYPRDPKSYNLDPIRLQVRLDNEHAEQLVASVDKGLPISLPAGAILKVDSTSPLLRELFQRGDQRHLNLRLNPAVPDSLASREIVLRIVGGKGPQARVLPDMPFKVVRFGRKEATMTSSTYLPINISITMMRELNQGVITVESEITGANVCHVAEVFHFFDALEQSGELAFFTAESPRRFLGGNIGNEIKPNIPLGLKRLVFDVAAISDYFKTPINLPEEFLEDDLETVQTIYWAITGETLPEFGITGSLVKETVERDFFLGFMEGLPISVYLDVNFGSQAPTVFGTVLPCAPIKFVCEEVYIVNGRESLNAYEAAPEGTPIPFKACCKGPCRYLFVDKKV